MSFSWIPFHKEFAEKLLAYRSNRADLLKMIYANATTLKIDYLHDLNHTKCTDIDPFTTFGIINRGISKENRMMAAETFKHILSINAPVPSDFDGIPTLNNQKSQFVAFSDRRGPDDIENLWSLFEKLVNDLDISNEFNQVKKQLGININLTMGLFWIRPEKFLSLDTTNRVYLKSEYHIDIPKTVPEFDTYMVILDSVSDKIQKGIIKEDNFYQLSANANNNGTHLSDEEDYSWYDDIVERWKRSQNIVLQGAPGTGKTHDIPELVVRLCRPGFVTGQTSRTEVMQVYNALKNKGQICFTTFHQSMDYEDWIEGLRPDIDENGQVTYQPKKGIFVELCEKAERPIVKKNDLGIDDNATVWKVSLKGTGDNDIRTDCMKNGYIRIGWDKYGPEISDQTDWTIYPTPGKRELDAFINKMKIGDIVMSCYSGKTIDAIGIITGEYEFVDHFHEFKRLRKVNWLVKGINEDIVSLNDGKTMTLPSVYKLNSITLDKVKSLLDKLKVSSNMEENTLPYVMVIDELNRGNVSKIFGEMITLIESDKRKGAKNEESVTLPCSAVPFSIPKNVYIIATMNTADRSLGTLDYAIRRRFAFIPTKPYALDVDGFDNELFEKVSKLFISNYDDYSQEWDQSLRLEAADTLSEDFKPEDVWVGHSYFLMKGDNGEDLTSEKLLYQVIPLLEEYVRDGVLKESAQDTINELYEIAVQNG